MLNLSLSFPLALLIFLSPLSNIINATATTKNLPRGFSIDLIHRDSPLSPFYNSSTTYSERLQNAALRSISRANRFGQSSSSKAETSELVETDLLPDDGIYLMKISVGTPPVERLALADTGSDLIWFQCSPCPQCYPQNAQLFYPNSSSTYMSLSCNSDPCNSLPKYRTQDQTYPYCGTSNECTYLYLYGDNSYTVGELGAESVSFGQAASFPKTVFGCGHNNKGFSQNTSGLVGLGQGNLSLVSQIGNAGHKFSYCLPPLGQKTTTTKLRFGEEANISGNGLVSTRLITRSDSPSYYYLNLEGITVGQQRVALTNQSNNGNIIIDSGTTLTMLPSSFYDQVEALVKQAIKADRLIVQVNNFTLCYKNATSIQNVPNFGVHFTGANLSLKPQNIFLFFSDVNVMCFAMLPTDRLPIYGNVAHSDFGVEYDLQQKQVSFAPVDCTKQ